jgi:hypothetical protein
VVEEIRKENGVKTIITVNKIQSGLGPDPRPQERFSCDVYCPSIEMGLNNAGSGPVRSKETFCFYKSFMQLDKTRTDCNQGPVCFPCFPISTYIHSGKLSRNKLITERQPLPAVVGESRDGYEHDRGSIASTDPSDSGHRRPTPFPQPRNETPLRSSPLPPRAKIYTAYGFISIGGWTILKWILR